MGPQPQRLVDKEHPLVTHGWLSHLTWSWFFPLLKIGQRKQLDEGDVWNLPPTMRARAIHTRYTQRCQLYPTMSLREHMVRMFWKRWVIAGGCYFGWCVSAACQPYLVAAIVTHVANGQGGLERGLLLAAGLFVATIAYSFFINHKFAQLMENGVEIRSLLMTLLHRKVLAVALAEGVSTGEATNLMSNDAERVLEASLWLHYMWASPLFVLVIIALAYTELGPAALVGFGLLFLLIPTQIYFGKRVGARKRVAMPKTDKRTELFSQVLNGIEVVKLYSWEQPYASTLQDTRVDELKDILIINVIRAAMRAILFMAPALIPGATLMAYVAFGNKLTLDVAFLAISFFATVRFPTLIIPMAYSYFFEMLVSLKRIDRFLAMADAPPLVGHTHPHAMETHNNNNDNNNNIRGGAHGTTATADTAPNPATLSHKATLPTHRGAPSHNHSLHTPLINACISPAPLAATPTTTPFDHHDAVSVQPPQSITAVWEAVFWDAARKHQALQSVAVTVPRGALVGVTGVVGSGKTAFLLALLDELTVVRRHATVSGDEATSHVEHDTTSDGALTRYRHASDNDVVATPHRPPIAGYFAQTPEILNGTFKDNVTFGLPFDAHRFNEAVTCACLDADLAIMPAGSMTEIGENGVNLSGGQKARVAFARMLYHRHRCSVFIIDDLFAAVDVHVGKRMFDKGINGLLRGTTRIIAASSQVDLLRHASIMLSIRDGTVTIDRQCLDAGNGGVPATDVSSMFVPESAIQPTLTENPNDSLVSDASKETDHHGMPMESTNKDSNITTINAPATTTHLKHDNSTMPHSTTVAITKNDVTAPSDDADNNTTTLKGRIAGENLTIKEVRQMGAVSSRVIRSYYDQSWPGHGGFVMSSVGVVYLVGQAIRVMCDVWIAWWADASSNGTDSTAPGTLERQSDRYWIWTLAVWNVSNMVFAMVRSLWCAQLSALASEHVHKQVLKQLLAAPLLFFHQNPPGRILNRLSTDLHKVDTLLPDILYQFLDNFVLLLSALILAVVVVPWLLVLLVLIGWFYYKIQAIYRATSRELHRLDGTTKSPIFGLCSESVGARVTIRAYAMLEHFITLGESLIDTNLKVYLSVKLLERWISTYMNLAATLFGTALVVVAVVARDQVDPAMVGLALVYSLQLMGLSSWTMMVFVQVEATMTSLERLCELAAVPSQETPTVTDRYRDPPPHWPTSGTVTMRDARLRYRSDLPLALKGISVSIAAEEKIGVCGRTGAGKSSVLALLYRLFEPEPGSLIEIDGVDITTVDLHRLRHALAIVPQDPVMFNGTVRSNLDPWGVHDDAALWNVLEQVTLKPAVVSFPRQLDESTGRAGDRLSHGQRQLMCIARALLKPSKILLCDEATSSVDSHTDAVIQQLIRHAFKDRTVLTIAHRLHTILDSDRILVLQDGRVAEFDAPSALLSVPHGLFRSMLESTSAPEVINDLTTSTVSPTTTAVQPPLRDEQQDDAHGDGNGGGDNLDNTDSMEEEEGWSQGRLRNASMPHVLVEGGSALAAGPDTEGDTMDRHGVSSAPPHKLRPSVVQGGGINLGHYDPISEGDERAHFSNRRRRTASYLEATNDV
eukprot:m.161407 g.161407  ORF g.161407 m.161407 type:complete len:1586 (+) comp12073_c0_seq1:309-5066(+)